MSLKTPEEKIKEVGKLGFSDFDEVSKEWQKALGQIEVDKAYSELKNTKDIISAAKSRIDSINFKLTEERNMSTNDREYLLGVKDTLNTLIYWFNPQDYDSRRKAIEDDIDKNMEKGD